ncbi:MAG: DUF5337 domain-containing protein [Halocynthiibacter sp.]
MSKNRNDISSQGRVVAIVIAAAGVVWVLANLAGSKLNWSIETMLFFDLAVLAAFIWALVVTYQIWRKRQKDEG